MISLLSLEDSSHLHTHCDLSRFAGFDVNVFASVRVTPLKISFIVLFLFRVCEWADNTLPRLIDRAGWEPSSETRGRREERRGKKERNKQTEARGGEEEAETV